jgi:hypothetical protein
MTFMAYLKQARVRNDWQKAAVAHSLSAAGVESRMNDKPGACLS